MTVAVRSVFRSAGGLRVALLALIALVLPAAPALAQSGSAMSAQGNHARVSLVSERSQAIPGETLYLSLHMEMDKGWHVYWRNAGDAGLPPEILWDEGPLAPETSAGDFVWPMPELLPVVPDEIMDYGYSGEVTLPIPVTVPDDARGEIRFSGTADYLICKDVCIPETAPVRFTLQVGETQDPDRDGGTKIAEALSNVPAPFEGTARVRVDDGTATLSLRSGDLDLSGARALRFFPYGDEIRHAADQSASVGPDGAALRLERAPGQAMGETLSGVIAVTREDGSRVGLVVEAPRGDDILPGTADAPLAPLTAASGSDGTLGLAAILGLALIGGIVLNLMPCVLPVLSIKAMGMVRAAAGGERSHLRSHGLAYTAGVLVSFAAIAATFTGLRAAGEFVSLGFQLQYPPVVAALALLIFAIGLWLFGMFELGTSIQGAGGGLAAREGPTGAFFTGVLAAVVGAPCVGPFLGAALGAVIAQPVPVVFLVFLTLGFGLALPFLALSFVPGLQRVLPKPGAWMERLKQLFAFPMFLTAIWLLSVLGDQAGMGAVAWTLTGAALLVFAIWVLKTAGGTLRPLALAVGGAALIGSVTVPLQAALAGQDQASTGGAEQTAYGGDFETVAWSPERVEAALDEGKGVFVDFTATWCMICQANKRTTLSKPEVRRAMESANIVFMVADFTRKDERIAEALRAHGRAGVPMYLLYGPGKRTPEILPQTLTPGLVLEKIAEQAGRAT